MQQNAPLKLCTQSLIQLKLVPKLARLQIPQGGGAPWASLRSRPTERPQHLLHVLQSLAKGCSPAPDTSLPPLIQLLKVAVLCLTHVPTRFVAPRIVPTPASRAHLHVPIIGTSLNIFPICSNATQVEKTWIAYGNTLPHVVRFWRNP